MPFLPASNGFRENPVQNPVQTRCTHFFWVPSKKTKPGAGFGCFYPVRDPVQTRCRRDDIVRLKSRQSHATKQILGLNMTANPFPGGKNREGQYDYMSAADSIMYDRAAAGEFTKESGNVQIMLLLKRLRDNAIAEHRSSRY